MDQHSDVLNEPETLPTVPCRIRTYTVLPSVAMHAVMLFRMRGTLSGLIQVLC